MKPIVLENARIVDPSRNIDEMGSVIMASGKIIASGASARNQGIPDTANVINLKGKAIFPGLVDARVFVGEPGAEHRETIASASYAAAVGGITSFIMMPDTYPVIDNVALVEFILRTAKEMASVNIYPAASLTRGMAGLEISEFGLLREGGAVAFTEGKKTIANANIMRQAMTYARDFDMPIMHETQEADLIDNGVMNAGLIATYLGLPGILREAEVIPLERDLRLAELTGVRYHAAQLSTNMSAQAICCAKERMFGISAGVSINHLSLNENDVGEYRTFFRLLPPLRAEEDRVAMVKALRDGVIDIIVSSHDPQDVDTKHLPFADAQPGAIGLETLLAAALRLYHDGSIPLKRLIESLSTRPAQLFGLDAGTLKPGAMADLIIVDLDTPWILELDMLHSRSKNSTFEKVGFQGRVMTTIVAGKVVYSSGLTGFQKTEKFDCCDRK
ncbi:MAG: dihydroorotase [Candidatus Tokpelaia sp. JSC188]|nr:MAG: dihydroorotase [Candidatus Tokpelaia sp. JSC188]